MLLRHPSFSRAKPRPNKHALLFGYAIDNGERSPHVTLRNVMLSDRPLPAAGMVTLLYGNPASDEISARRREAEAMGYRLHVIRVWVDIGPRLVARTGVDNLACSRMLAMNACRKPLIHHLLEVMNISSMEDLVADPSVLQMMRTHTECGTSIATHDRAGANEVEFAPCPGTTHLTVVTWPAKQLTAATLFEPKNNSEADFIRAEVIGQPGLVVEADFSPSYVEWPTVNESRTPVTTIPEGQPVTGADLVMLSAKLGLRQSELAALFGSSSLKWRKLIDSPLEVVPPPIAILARWIDAHADRYAMRKAGAQAVFDQVRMKPGGKDTLTTMAAWALSMGLDASAGSRLLKGRRASETVEKIMTIMSAEDDLAGWLDVVRHEAAARGLGNIFERNSWVRKSE